MKELKSLLFFACLLFICFDLVFTGSLIKSKIEENQKNSELFLLGEDGNFIFNKQICQNLSNLEELSKKVKESIVELITSFKIQVKKFLGKKSPVSRKSTSIQMKIVSAYLDEVHKVTQVVKKIKVNFKEFKKNGCSVTKEQIKNIYLADKILAKLVYLIKKHVKRIESPFKAELNMKMRSVNFMKKLTKNQDK